VVRELPKGRELTITFARGLMDAVGAERDREVTDDCAGFGKNRLRRGQLDDSVAHGAEGQIASCPRGAHRGRRFWRRVTVPDFGVS